jgi:5-(carboxyamino)imidazole ribonucleotide mutase
MAHKFLPSNRKLLDYEGECLFCYAFHSQMNVFPFYCGNNSFGFFVFHNSYKWRNKMQRPLVGIIMGSTSDWETMKHACDILDELEISYEKQVVSAHRTPDHMFRYAETAKERGLHVIIAGAGGAAHLPGMVAAKTVLPVIGVPVQSQALNGLDSLLSIVQMPGGVPVATVAIGKAGAVNAGLLAGQILGIHLSHIQERLEQRRRETEANVLESSELV